LPAAAASYITFELVSVLPVVVLTIVTWSFQLPDVAFVPVLRSSQRTVKVPPELRAPAASIARFATWRSG
jgi:hypothetical protein